MPDGPWILPGNLTKVTPVNDRTFDVEISSPSHAEAESLDKEETADEANLCLQATPLIQSSDSTVTALAGTLSAGVTDPAEVLDGLRQIVQFTLRPSYRFSSAHLSAREALRLKEGDCSEYSVLLAALERAKGIPARVVTGFRYSPASGTFVAHAWTEALVRGRWTLVDATPGDDADATYLKIEHRADLALPIDQAATPRAVCARAGIERIEVLEQEQAAPPSTAESSGPC